MMVLTDLVAASNDIFGDDNFPSGCAFSPDGLCLLTCSTTDSKLRLYNTPVRQQDSNVIIGLKAALEMDGCEAVRSYAWYPTMKSNEPVTCCFVAAAREQPIHLYDAYNGSVRASYRPFNHMDELDSACVTLFDPTGQKIAAAGSRTDRVIYVFDTAIPGRDSTVLRLGKTRRSSDGQKGIASAMTYSTDGKLLVVGTYAPGSIYIYDERSGQQPSGSLLDGLCVAGHGRNHAGKKRRFVTLEDEENEGDSWLTSEKVKWFQSRTRGGVTQVQFAPQNEYILYSAARRSDAILAWDIRMLSGNPDYQSRSVHGFKSFATKSDTNQRLQFCLDETGRTLFVGGRDCCVRIYDVNSSQLIGTIDGLGDAANGVSCTVVGSDGDTSYLAVASGSRKFRGDDDVDQEGTVASSQDSGPSGFLRIFQVRHAPDGLGQMN